MKKWQLTFLLFLNCLSMTYASEIPVPHCVKGQWMMDAGPLWSIEKTSNCKDDNDIKPYQIRASFIHPRPSSHFTIKTIFFDKTGQEAVTTVTHSSFVPWGLKWTGGRRNTSAYCPAETGMTNLKDCPILHLGHS